jgi:hypothetical protein
LHGYSWGTTKNRQQSAFIRPATALSTGLAAAAAYDSERKSRNSTMMMTAATQFHYSRQCQAAEVLPSHPYQVWKASSTNKKRLLVNPSQQIILTKLK